MDSLTATSGEASQPEHDDLNVNANLQVGDVDVAGGNPVPVTVGADDTWTVAHTQDETADDSDKEFAVTAAQLWQILFVWVEFTTTADAGDRQIVLQFQDGAADVIGEIRAGIVQADTITRNYMFAPALADLEAFRDTDFLMTPLPPTLLLPATYVLRVYDNNAVQVAADDMIVQIQYAWKTI